MSEEERMAKLLDKFSDKDKADRRKRKKMEVEEKRRSEAFYRDKYVAERMLNQLMTAEEAERVRSVWSGRCEYTPSELQNMMVWDNYGQVTGFTPYQPPKNFSCEEDELSPVVALSIGDYMNAVEHGRQWFDSQLTKLGFSTTLFPEYDPVSVSDTSSQLMFAYMELLKLHSKQLLRYQARQSRLLTSAN
jgi:hypothetical protein